ncbi:hypothetical protein WJX84_012007 [Apatococcus fuscideae]|uniref:Uncharacterized protein n=1 Tax=Apatococcus fuscideae TaxID=2026836 RepID=A0AAW1T205_9CHLO
MVGNRPEDICIHAASLWDFRRVHFVDSGVTSGIFEVMSEGFKEETLEPGRGGRRANKSCRPSTLTPVTISVGVQ